MKIMEFAGIRRRGLILAGCLLLGATGLYSGWWWWLAGATRSQIDGWVARQNTSGRSVGYGSLVIGGFPGRMQVVLANLRADDPEGGWKFAVPSLQAVLTPWAPGSIDGHIADPVSMQLDKGVLPGRYTLHAKSNALHLDAQDGGQMILTLDALHVADEGHGDALDIASLTATLKRGKAPVLGTVDLAIRDLDYPARWHNAFGQHLERLLARLQLNGEAFPSGPDAAAVRAWSNDGGAIDIQSLDLVHGVLGLNGEGTLALDNELQPIGAFTARIAGFQAAIDQLVAAGMVRADDGKLAKVVLGVMAKVPKGGGPLQISLPLTLQDRRLSVGPLPLVRLPIIVWQ